MPIEYSKYSTSITKDTLPCRTCLQVCERLRKLKRIKNYGLFLIFTISTVSAAFVRSELVPAKQRCRFKKFSRPRRKRTGSGTIEKHEFALVLQSVIDANSLALSHSQVQLLTDVLFEDIDADKNGVVTFEELSAALDKQPQWLEQLQLSASRFLRPPNLELDAAGVPKISSGDGKKSNKKPKRKSVCPPYCFTPKYAHKHPSKLVCLLVYILITIALYLYGSLDALNSYYAVVKSK